MTTFGSLLKSYRKRAKSADNRPLSQGVLGEAVGAALGIGSYSAQTISNWEKGRAQPNKDDRLTLQHLIAVLYRHGGLETLVEAERLLAAGNYRSLDRAEIEAIEPLWLLEKEGEPPLPTPYLGLRPFREEDEPFFFGRKLPSQQVAHAIQQTPIVTLVGAAGSGKTSLVQAGVVPLLREQSAEWQIITIPATKSPFHALANTFATLLEPYLSPTERLPRVESLTEQLQTGLLSLETLLPALPSHLLLIFDDWDQQLVDLSTQERVHLFEMLVAVSQAYSALRLLLIVRATSDLPAWQAENVTVTLPLPPRADLQCMIIEPVALQNVPIEGQLVTELLDKLEGQPGVLPLLAFVLELLWKQRREPSITYAALSALGGVEGVLANYARRIMAGYSTENQQTAHTIFLQLIQQDAAGDFIRQDTPFHHFSATEQALLRQLAADRLVTVEAQSQAVMAQIAHNALISQWMTAQKWFADDADFWQWRRQLRGAIRQWEDNDKQPRNLQGGTALATARAWLAVRPLNPVEVAFIEQSQQHRKVQRRRVRTGVAVFTLAALLGLFATFHQQRVRSARLLLDEARTHLADNVYDLALLRGLESVEAWDSAETNTALAAIWAQNPYLERYLWADAADFTQIAYLPNQQLIAGHSDGTLSLWDTTTYLQTDTRQTRHNYGVTALATNGTILATGGGDGSLALWRVGETQPYRIIENAHQGNLFAIAFGSDFLATSSDDVRFWDVETGEMLYEPIVGNGLVRGMGVSAESVLYGVTQARQLVRWEAGDVTITPLPNVLQSVAVSENSVAVGDSAGQITLLPPTRTITTSLLTVTALDYDAVGRLIASGCAAHVELSWECVRGGVIVRDDSSELRVVNIGLSDNVQAVAMGEGGRLFVAAPRMIAVLVEEMRDAPVGHESWRTLICGVVDCLP